MNPNNHTTIGGIYEVCIGVTDAISAIQYWQQFGYHIGEIGELTAATAYQLYQVNSSWFFRTYYAKYEFIYPITL